MIPDGAREGNLLGMSFDPDHIPDTLEFWGGVLSGDYVRVAQTIHPEDEIERYPGPVLIVQGDADETVLCTYAEKAVKLYKNAKLVLIHGDDHCFTKHLDEMAAAVKSFFM